MTKEVNEKTLQSHFSTILNQIQRMRSLAASEVNEKHLSSVWFVGQYVSQKIKSNEWGTKVVAELADYIHTQDPTLKGFSKRNIYNMVMFYDEYSSEGFLNFVAEKLNSISTWYVPKLYIQAFRSCFDISKYNLFMIIKDGIFLLDKSKRPFIFTEPYLFEKNMLFT